MLEEKRKEEQETGGSSAVAKKTEGKKHEKLNSRFQFVYSQPPFHSPDAGTTASLEQIRALQAEIGDAKEKYEAIEHKAIGDRAFFELRNDNQDPDIERVFRALESEELLRGMTWALPNELNLSSGDLVALAGDFYGLPSEPICEGEGPEVQQDRFRRAYDSLCARVEDDAAQKALHKEVKGIRKLFTKEKNTIHDHLEYGHGPRHALHSIANSQNVSYAKITQLTCLPIPFLHSRYLALAANNFDHFKDDARAAYRAGHEEALAAARAAHGEANESKRLRLFVHAITQELFACHFFTDLFASGHLRTIRRDIFNHVQQTGRTIGKAYIAGLLAKEMHDEDNKNGLLVADRLGHQWKAYGDACYFESVNQDNLIHVTRAVIAALHSIINTYLGREVDYNFEDYLPVPSADNLSQPLFKMEEGTLKVRKDLDNINSAEYEEVTSPAATLLKFKIRFFRPTQEEPALTEESIRQIRENLEQLVEAEELSFEDATGNEQRCTIL